MRNTPSERLRFVIRVWTLAVVLLAGIGAGAPARAEQNPWGGVGGPAGGPARVVGFYSNGCIAGAGALPRSGPGYVVLRPARNRFWAHPAMVRFLGDLARPYANTGEALLIADIGQPRGGPAAGHASHQTGLDADIRLVIVPRARITDAYRDKPPKISMLGAGRKAIDAGRFSARQAALIRAAANDPRVDRLFVNPVIKRALCRRPGADKSWLGKVVPWYGHDAHMHVRLRCPPGSPACVAQKSLPPGDGCGPRLARWFIEAPAKARKIKRPRRARPPLPKACAAVLRR